MRTLLRRTALSACPPAACRALHLPCQLPASPARCPARCLLPPALYCQVRLVKELAPAQRVGFIVQDDSAAARAAGMHRLHRLPGADVVGLHWSMATAEAVQVSTNYFKHLVCRRCCSC